MELWGPDSVTTPYAHSGGKTIQLFGRWFMILSDVWLWRNLDWLGQSHYILQEELGATFGGAVGATNGYNYVFFTISWDTGYNP
jgi:hypothetical protein